MDFFAAPTMIGFKDYCEYILNFHIVNIWCIVYARHVNYLENLHIFIRVKASENIIELCHFERCSIYQYIYAQNLW